MNKKTAINDLLSSAIIGGLCLGAICFPAAVQKIYENATAKSVKEYRIKIENNPLFATGGVSVRGDTTATLYFPTRFDQDEFREGKEYKIQIIKYGFFGENKIKNMGEIK
jgi:hypothetical protein